MKTKGITERAAAATTLAEKEKIKAELDSPAFRWVSNKTRRRVLRKLTDMSKQHG